MEKNIEIGMLYEFYSSLLTDKQQYVIDSYCNNDLSLTEIAQELKISRQGVQKQIKDAKRQLYNYEEKLQLVKKFMYNIKIIKNINLNLDILGKMCNDKNIITNIKNDLEKIN